MRTLLAALLISALVLPTLAVDAYAHGGQYRGPGGALPPDLREPSDPNPPPPPPPSSPPTTGTPSGPASGPTPRATTPTPPTGTPPTVTPGPFAGPGRQPRTRATITPDSWVFWYEYNKDVLEELKHHIYQFSDTNPLAMMTGRAGPSARSGARQATRAAVQSDVIPALLWAMNPKHHLHQDIESAAYIALAKVTTDPTHIEQIQKGLTSRNKITRESSALALGLLRRERPAEQFDAKTLDGVRRFLFALFDNESQAIRTRAFAALALGLLGDQPTQEGGAAQTTQGLFERLARPQGNLDLPVCLLQAIAMQPPTSLQSAQKDVLRTIVNRQRVGTQDLVDVVACYAAKALGQVGDPATDCLALLRILQTRRRVGVNMLRSATIAVGTLGSRAGQQDRVEAAQALQKGIDLKQIKDATARKFAYISLAYLARADLEAGCTGVLAEARVGRFLLEEAENGRYADRPFAALALSLICREIGDTPSVELVGEFQSRAREVLRAGLASQKNDARCRAAFAVALGMARDELSVSALARIVDDRKADDGLRGYAAVGLGHIGIANKRVLPPIRRALVAHRSERLGRASATALGLLHDRKAVPLLLEELGRGRSQSVKGQAVVALARVGDERAIPKLIAVLRDDTEQDLTRALACAGLGIVGDLAWVPSISLISRDVNYRASVDAINEVLSIL